MMKKIKKLGLDIHGVCDADPQTYANMADSIIKMGGEVHIISGQKDTPELREKIKNLKIPYTHFFSITTYHESIGTPIRYDEKNHPWMDAEMWDRTKADYCEREGIDMHIDDSPVYGKYFKKSTTYVLVSKQQKSAPNG